MDTGIVKKDRDFEERTKLLFDESVAALNGETRSKLTQARYRALKEMKGQQVVGWNRRWIPAGVAAVIAVLSLMLWQGQVELANDGGFDMATVIDLEILLTEVDLDMFQELEFYAWLDEQAELTSGQILEDGIG